MSAGRPDRMGGRGGAVGHNLLGDGQQVVFQSSQPLVAGVPDNGPRAYVRDLLTGATQVLVAGPGGSLPRVSWPVLSADGRHASFVTTARLAPGDTNKGSRDGIDGYTTTVG